MNPFYFSERTKFCVLTHMVLTVSGCVPPEIPPFRDDKVCYTLDDQYMVGADILFAPIYEQGCTSRKVYLPKGKWILTKDGTKYNGACYIEVEAQIHEFIAFVTPESGMLDYFIIR